LLSNDALNGTQFSWPKATVFRQTHRIKPKLGSVALSLHMDVPGFCAVIRPEKEAIRADAKRCWHGELAFILQNTFP
jgi:hypothetical protein